MLEIKGKLKSILPEVTGVSNNGNQWKKQEFVITTEGQYPKDVCFVLWGDNTDVLATLAPGVSLAVNFNPESREYNGQYYTDLKAWKVAPAVGTAKGSTNRKPIPVDNTMPVDPTDDLPF
jgi:hypothetical protein